MIDHLSNISYLATGHFRIPLLIYLKSHMIFTNHFSNQYNYSNMRNYFKKHLFSHSKKYKMISFDNRITK